MLANNVALAHILSILGWGQKVFFFLKVVSYDAYHINWNDAWNTMQANTLSLHTNLAPVEESKDQILYFESGHVVFQIIGKEV